MNTDNNNLGNNYGTENLGGYNPEMNGQTPVQPTNTFTPFQNLDNAPLNVPGESPVVSEPTPVVPQTPVDNSFVQPSVEVPVQPTYSEPVAPVVEQPINQAPSFETTQSAPTIESIEAPAPDYSQNNINVDTLSEPVPEVNNLNASIEMPAANVGINNVVEEPVSEAPTLPTPETTPSSTSSTPVDYATPMSNFDDIGTTPELDPKAKGKKKANKLAVILLFLIIIAGLGGGAYYLINVKGILNKDSVTVKSLKSEKGETLSTNISDYATFENTSASNCILDTNDVNINEVGSYKFKITCGEKVYTGDIEIVDNKAPEVEVITNAIIAGNALLPENFASANEEATFTFSSEEEAAAAFQTAGLKILDLKVADAKGNSKEFKAPVIVTSAEYSVILAEKKQLSLEDGKFTITEKNIILYNGSAGWVNDTGYTAYIINFSNSSEYENAVKTYDNSGSMSFNSYVGTPLFYKSKNTIVLIRDINTDLIKPDYQQTLEYGKENGYAVETAIPTTDSKVILNFDQI